MIEIYNTKDIPIDELQAKMRQLFSEIDYQNTQFMVGYLKAVKDISDLTGLQIEAGFFE